ncbi:hypothetical protein CLOM_g10299 [Closterium sp. NIES-68]|nr:hypothetical protein CLOM_g10299 [Closterium sp. NIES-68]GJP78136.1 hypothetical protein CLOP_g8469 [Closterium sp. NIES-67]
MRGSSGLKRVGKYEVGRTVGEGNFAKVKVGQHVESGRRVAIKVMDKDKILRHRMADQIKREVSIMKMVRHPNIVQLIEVLASRSKIFMVLEFAAGGELFDKIVYRGRLPEDEARRYFQQLVDAVDCCHAKGVCHRDLKPENMLLDEHGNLKVSDFGLSALPQQLREDGLLHTTCGTPNYVAPEVLHNKGYDGRLADVWSCGVILFVLLAGYVPFDEPDLVLLYDKISRAHFKFPPWFSLEVKRLITRILNPDPSTRPGLDAIRQDVWFQRGYQRAKPLADAVGGEGDAADVLLEAGLHPVTELSVRVAHSPSLQASLPVSLDPPSRSSSPPATAAAAEAASSLGGGGAQAGMAEEGRSGPLVGGGAEECPELLNAFDLIARAHALDLGALFQRRAGPILRPTRFASRLPPALIRSRLLALSPLLHAHAHATHFKIRLERPGSAQGGHLAVVIQIFEMTAGLFMVEARKAAGDTLEYHKLYRSLLARVKDMVWHPEGTAALPAAPQAPLAVPRPLATAQSTPALPQAPAPDEAAAAGVVNGVAVGGSVKVEHKGGAAGLLEEKRRGAPTMHPVNGDVAAHSTRGLSG